MRIIKEKNNSSNMVRFYEIEGLNDYNKIALWFNKIKNINGFKSEQYNLYDFLHRNEEDSDSSEIDADVDISVLENKLKTLFIDVINLNGTFYDMPVIVGMDLRTKNVSITIRKSKPADINRLERELENI
ncbi:MAG: hypothetical protein K6G26_04740 [Lachnospiraceae bacterium]|nr:hypothetical protein [Lachnospiraceae bacterium]